MANNEELKVNIGGKSLTLNTQNLLSILLLVAGVVGGYLIYTSIDSKLDRGAEQHKTLYEHVTTLHNETRKMLITHDYNLGRDVDNKLPLTILPETVAPRQ